MSFDIKRVVAACLWLLWMHVLALASAFAVTPEIDLAASPLLSCAGNPSSTLALNGALVNMQISKMDIASGTEFIYQSSFNPAKWSGGFKKFALELDAYGELKIAAVASWDAAENLTGSNQKAPDPSSHDRKIYTSSIQADGSYRTIELRWNLLTTEQRDLLDASPGNGAADGLGERRLNYLRGERRFEQGRTDGLFRMRDGVLGDIVNSNSVYVGPPASNVQGRDYQKFHQDYQDRIKAVYVGANDGMLHAFNAENGKEVFSYVPRALFSGLNQLSNPDYEHRPYVDGALAVAEVMVAGSWKTVLASGLGGGAQGLVALDVSNPADFGNAAGVIWEFTDSDDADIGNLIGVPVIAKFKVGTAGGIPEYKYFVVVPSGLNNYKMDGAGQFNSTASSALFLLSLDKVPAARWELGVNYFKFMVPVTDATSRHGLSVPGLAIGNNSVVRYAYAGDLQGNVWRFDFTGSAPWVNARSGDAPLFTAKDSQGFPQPITTQPKIVFAPDGGYVVLFGTGKFIEKADAVMTAYKEQSFYGIYDSTQPQANVANRSQLALRTLTKEKNQDLKIAGDDFVYGATEGGKKGWYFDFLDSAQSGERSVTNAVTVEGKLFFNTFMPNSNHCEKGSGRSYSLNALTGLPWTDDATGNLSMMGGLSSPNILPTGVISGSGNLTGKEKGQNKYAVYNLGSSGNGGELVRFKTGGRLGTETGANRLSWREVVNWQELRNAANKK